MINRNFFFVCSFLAFISFKANCNRPLGQFIAAQYSNLSSNDNSEAIKPYNKNSWYWEYKGVPILLYGGTNNDNLFQWTENKLTDHLDLLSSLGGNYVRNTMSDRDPDDVFAHKLNNIGKYDLNVWNDEYWNRLENFLNETTKKGIIVQLTLWDIYDLDGSRYSVHPLNPSNNVNWEPGVLVDRDSYYDGSLITGNQKVIDYQRRYIDKLTSITFKYNNVLYNITNESPLSLEWETYWATYLNSKAAEAGKSIYVTSMHMSPSNGVRHVMTNRDVFSFIEISQNSQNSRGGRGKSHYDNIIYWRRLIEADPRGNLPMNNEKIYGSGEGRSYSFGTGIEAEERFWKNVFAGCASVRFHRPGGGIGLTERAQTNIKSMTMFLEEFDIFYASPYEGIKMYERASEGYSMAIMGKQYAVYLPGGRYSVELDTWIFAKKVKVKYLDIDSSTWSEERIIDLKWEEDLSEYFGFQKGINIMSPANRPCVAIVEVVE